MIPLEPSVYIVDDDAAVRDSLALLLGLNGYQTQTFASAEGFLAAWRPERNGCLLLDLKMPGMDGLALQARLNALGSRLPLVVITAHGDVAAARAALKAGALDFLEKPIDDILLLELVSEVMTRAREATISATHAADLDERMARLTTREREVMELAADGLNNREIAVRLAISPRTVEVYKARMMEKMQVRRLSELIRLLLGRA
jgi:two-component system, LuxR family, response regulator FixJ